MLVLVNIKDGAKVNVCYSLMYSSLVITLIFFYRPHSSQSACIRPSRLYRHSAHLSHRLSMQSQPQSRLKPVPIPMSPNCDINHNKDRFSRFPGPQSDTASILSPTGSTVSSLLSIPVFPGYRSIN